MAHSFFAPSDANSIEDYVKNNTFYHAASDTHYQMLRRDGKFYQRRFQIGFDGKETNSKETRIDFVAGSGLHARTYLHRTEQGMLVELPLGWYSEKGGYWAMSPGYDFPQHPNEQRTVGNDCMFCHNAYPQETAERDRFGDIPHFAEKLPEGIDCQRCHGSGERHVAVASSRKAKKEDVRAAIVNPARLPLERQMEVCMQCHLQANTLRPTHDFKVYGRDWFAYQPSEPLGAFLQFFDAPEGGDANRFQIASTVYRLRQSQCFLKSAGALQCTTCHNPHDIRHGAQAAKSYDQTCLKCHTAALRPLIAAKRHTSAANCIDCHMPKRRTQDAVHVTMTDHLIQRRPDANLLAEIAEDHETPVPSAPVHAYYPAVVPDSTEGRLRLAIAQVRENANLPEGLAQLLRLLEKEPPTIADPYFETADALRNSGHLPQAVPMYQQAARLDAGYVSALLGLGSTLQELGNFGAAEDTLRQAMAVAPEDARLWSTLGRAQIASGHATEAKETLQKAVTLDRDAASPHIGLGVILAQAGMLPEASAEFREAIRLQPNAGEPHAYLASLLMAQQDISQAGWEFERAIRFAPKEIAIRLQYAAVLYTLNRTDDALQQVDAAVQMQPRSAEAQHLRGNILEKQGKVADALQAYQEAVRLQPSSARAQLDLGAVLAQTGNRDEAIVHLKLAAQAEDENVRRIALQSLADLGVK